MNDVDQPQEPEAAQAEKQTLTPREQPPYPVFTVHSDGRIELHRRDFAPIDLQRVLLNTALIVTSDAFRTSDARGRVLSKIQDRFDGFGEELDAEMATVLGQRA
jgi:hypothetical protein